VVAGGALAQGQVWWAELPTPVGSGPGFRLPVLVIQGNAFDRSRIGSVVVVPLTRNLRLVGAPGNVLLTAQQTGLPEDSVANVSQIATIDRDLLDEVVGQVSGRLIEVVLAGVDIVLGR
jgi:mRNA interferase MazF